MKYQNLLVDFLWLFLLKWVKTYCRRILLSFFLGPVAIFVFESVSQFGGFDLISTCSCMDAGGRAGVNLEALRPESEEVQSTYRMGYIQRNAVQTQQVLDSYKGVCKTSCYALLNGVNLNSQVEELTNLTNANQASNDLTNQRITTNENSVRNQFNTFNTRVSRCETDNRDFRELNFKFRETETLAKTNDRQIRDIFPRVDVLERNLEKTQNDLREARMQSNEPHARAEGAGNRRQGSGIPNKFVYMIVGIALTLFGQHVIKVMGENATAKAELADLKKKFNWLQKKVAAAEQ